MINFILGFREAVDILKHTHELLSKDLSIDSFSLTMHEMQAVATPEILFRVFLFHFEKNLGHFGLFRVFR